MSDSNNLKDNPPPRLSTSSGDDNCAFSPNNPKYVPPPGFQSDAGQTAPPNYGATAIVTQLDEVAIVGGHPAVPPLGYQSDAGKTAPPNYVATDAVVTQKDGCSTHLPPPGFQSHPGQKFPPNYGATAILTQEDRIIILGGCTTCGDSTANELVALLNDDSKDSKPTTCWSCFELFIYILIVYFFIYLWTSK